MAMMTSRRAAIGAGLLAIPAAVTAATTAAPTTPAGISPELAALLAKVDEAEAAANRNSDEYDVAAEAVRAVESRFPHIKMHIANNHEGKPIIFSTADQINVAVAGGVAHRPLGVAGYDQQCRKFYAAHLRRARAIKRTPEAKRLSVLQDRDEELGLAWSNAQSAVASFRARSAVDFATIVAFAVEHDLFAVDGVAFDIAASARRLLGQEA